jgi:hypothetical protein
LSASTPTQARQSRVAPAEPVNSAGTAGDHSDPVEDPVVAANSRNNEEQFINAVLGLADIIAASSANTTTQTQKVKEPDTFNGSDSSKLDEWITQVTLYFTANPSVYASDENKVLFAMSYLLGQALAWFQPDLLGGLTEDVPEPAWATDFAAFITELVVNFGPYDAIGDAESKLELLQMQDSEHITEFLVKFNLQAG